MNRKGWVLRPFWERDPQLVGRPSKTRIRETTGDDPPSLEKGTTWYLEIKKLIVRGRFYEVGRV